MLVRSNPEHAKVLLQEAQQDVISRWKMYEHWASMPGNGPAAQTTATEAVKESK
jgi:hypothetical protein